MEFFQDKVGTIFETMISATWLYNVQFSSKLI